MLFYQVMRLLNIDFELMKIGRVIRKSKNKKRTLRLGKELWQSREWNMKMYERHKKMFIRYVHDSWANGHQRINRNF